MTCDIYTLLAIVGQYLLVCFMWGGGLLAVTATEGLTGLVMTVVSHLAVVERTPLPELYCPSDHLHVITVAPKRHC